MCFPSPTWQMWVAAGSLCTMMRILGVPRQDMAILSKKLFLGHRKRLLCGRNLHTLPLLYSPWGVFCADSLVILSAESAECFGFRFLCQSLLSISLTVPLPQLCQPCFWALGSAHLSRVSFHPLCYLHVTSTRFSFPKPFSLPVLSAWHTLFLLVFPQSLSLLHLRSVLKTLGPTCQL